MKVIQLDTLLHDIESGDAPVSGYAVVDWLKSRAFDDDSMSYLDIKYSNESIPIQHGQTISFSQEVKQFMDTYDEGLVIACCHLNTYPNDIHYCSGHGLFGDNRDSNDCRYKNRCMEISERRTNEGDPGTGLPRTRRF